MRSLLVMMLASVVVISCGETQRENDEQNKLRQYIVQGEKLYLQHCANCHQKDGSGLAALFPPLNQSDFLDKNKMNVPCIIRNGLDGEIVVNGKIFNQPMKAIPLLTDLEVAEITTYILNNWGRNDGIIDVKATARMLQRCK